MLCSFHKIRISWLKPGSAKWFSASGIQPRKVFLFKIEWVFCVVRRASRSVGGSIFSFASIKVQGNEEQLLRSMWVRKGKMSVACGQFIAVAR